MVKIGTGALQRVKRPGRGADHSPPSKCRVHERVGLNLYSSCDPSWPVIGRTLCKKWYVINYVLYRSVIGVLRDRT